MMNLFSLIYEHIEAFVIIILICSIAITSCTTTYLYLEHKTAIELNAIENNCERIAARNNDYYYGNCKGKIKN